jgi:hypothetical protein
MSYRSNGAGLVIETGGKKYATNPACYPEAHTLNGGSNNLPDDADAQKCAILDGHGGIVPQQGLVPHSAGFKQFLRQDVEIDGDSPLARLVRAAA